MADKSDFFKVAPVHLLKVSSKHDNHQNPNEQQKKKKKESKYHAVESIKGVEELNTSELVEFGRIILSKRNVELKLFLRMKNHKELMKSDSFIQSTIQTEIVLLQAKLAEFDKDLQELDLKLYDSGNLSHDVDLDYALSLLEQLFNLYHLFFDCVKEEVRLLNIEDIDFLDTIIKQKEDILNDIVVCQKKINFDFLKKISPENEKKIKANQILSDIHNVINEIIKQEDENSVELHSLMEKMKLDIARQDRGAKAISQYAQTSLKSHFIDTKK